MDFVRCANLESVECVIRNFAVTFPRFVLSEQMLKQLANKLYNFGIVEYLQINGEQCAYAGYYCNDHENGIAYISMIATSERHRGQGFGRTMLDRVCTVSKDNGMNKLRLEVRNDNYTAVSFYTKNGFNFEKAASNETQYMIKLL